MADPVRDAVLRKDSRWLSGWFSGRWMIDVPVEWVETQIGKGIAWLKEMTDSHNQRYGTSYTPEQALSSGGVVDLWFRARATADNLYKAGENPAPNDSLPVELHIGFLGIWETEEQLARLRNEPKVPLPKHLGTAVSKIESTVEKISPIDRVAKRVAPTDGPAQESGEAS